MNVTQKIRTDVSKAVEQLALIDRSYGRGIWPTARSKEDWKHDLSIMRAHGDLQQVRLELLDATRCEQPPHRLSKWIGRRRVSPRSLRQNFDVFELSRVIGPRLNSLE